MAYQQQGGLGNHGGGGAEHHGPQGTEYTLQGQSPPAILYNVIPFTMGARESEHALGSRLLTRDT